MIEIKKVEFRGAFVDLDKLPQGEYPEIALVGRSNVGKSSLINKVVNRRNLAKSSSNPGKTRTINFYMINDSWYFVDLPGYGFAQVSKEERLKWKKMIEGYLSQRRQLKGVIQLLDIRHVPTENDVLMKDWLMYHEIPILMVATKADKISRGKREKHIRQIREKLELDANHILIPFSAETGEGVKEVLAAIEEIL
ncbi:GTP-binding protein [Thermosyntropha lipolytica DSM 11003]|uniref:Probable GTP-binding protein EngB n=1 Tax=Thermosyntropha lipolytica DSM 11003 TaxID=1123382 RepID=A0A1M5MMJ2_9FIRM|nr:ribosome biogenesis GTP-binding protein YihA/YsxC [Thermosyntropha lipolytica]SHG78139.1 GTP-binding protein [Thermosyntropha lipolytica DSM 11003]